MQYKNLWSSWQIREEKQVNADDTGKSQVKLAKLGLLMEHATAPPVT